MSKYVGESDFSHDAQECSGVLLTNLGTPDAPTPAALRRYLGEFLADPRVVEFPRALWWLVLHGVILRIRPRRAAHAYRKVWTADGSPLLSFSRRQAAALQDALAERFSGPVKVALAMRYGNPSIAAGLEELRRAGARRIVLLPLYPQYSATTTGSTFDAVAEVLRRWRWLPELRMITHYHDHPRYVHAIADSIRAAWSEQPAGDQLLFSFHGLPQRYLTAGDPYHCQCHKTARLVAEELQLPAERWQVVFQSRFGREPWLQPYADKTLRTLPANRVRRVDVVCPGFSADCLETLEEMAQQNRDLFLHAGGEGYRYIPALNDSVPHIDLLSTLIAEHTQGWPETGAGWSIADNQREAAARRQRALALGASR